MKGILFLTAFLASSVAFADAPRPVHDDIDLAAPFTLPRVNLDDTLRGETVVYSDASGTLKSNQAKDPADRQEQSDEDAHRLTVATIWLAALTSVLAIAAVIQIRMLIVQLRLTKRSADDANTAALAAKASAEALPLIERAYVFVKVSFEVALIERMEQVGTGVMNNVQATYTGTIAVSIYNYGKTPAALRRLRAYAFTDQQQPTELIAHEKADNKIADGIVIAPSAHPYVYRIPLTGYNKERLAQLHDVIWRIYCLGVVDYEDVLGKKRETGFCWQSYSIKNQLDFVISPSALNYRT